MSKLIKYRTPPLPKYPNHLQDNSHLKLDNEDFYHTIASSQDMTEENNDKEKELSEG